MAGISQIRQVGRISRMLPETERGLLPSPGNSVRSENRVWYCLYVTDTFRRALEVFLTNRLIAQLSLLLDSKL